MKKTFINFAKIFIFPITRIFTEKIEGKENFFKYDSFILVSNHNNGLDHFFIGNALKDNLKNVHFVGAMDNFKILLMSGLLYQFSDTIVIDRKKPKRKEFLEVITKYLKKGKIIIIYPEGDVNKTKFLLRGKTGVAELALKNRVPIIPVGIKKAENSFKKIVKIGTPLTFPLETEEFKNLERNQKDYTLLLTKVTDKIMQEISNLCGKPYNYK